MIEDLHQDVDEVQEQLMTTNARLKKVIAQVFWKELLKLI